jgi:hypothetical protein
MPWDHIRSSFVFSRNECLLVQGLSITAVLAPALPDLFSKKPVHLTSVISIISN